jgi:hypothetical protein
MVRAMRWAVAAAVFPFLSIGPTLPRAGGVSDARDLPFEDCLLLIQDVGQSLGVEATSVVETSDMRLVRFSVFDGSLLVTCSRPDSKIVMVRSPVR